MEAVAASTEISVLAWSVVLLLAQIVLQASVLGDLTPIVQGVMAQLIVLVVVPLVALATAQLYVEVRVVGEGLDLVILVRAGIVPGNVDGLGRVLGQDRFE